MKKFFIISLIFSFISSSLYVPQVHADVLNLPPLPTPGAIVHLSPEFTPAVLKGIVIHPENAFKFDFLVYKGDKVFTESQKKQEYTKLIKYFLASLAVPDEDQWVNLSPYEKNRIINNDFGKTEMGRDLLAQDYLLKQITASLIYPQDKLGRKFWDEVYARAYKQFGTTKIPVNTFNKVWILPDDADIYEKGNIAYLYRSHLKVMLEEDYLSLKKHGGIESVHISNDTHSIGSQVVREIVLPQLEKEVNEDKNFAPLRQVFSGMILAAWYKRALRESLLGKIYDNKAKVKGVDQDPRNNDAIYRQYLKAYKKGVFNYIQEDVDKYTNETIPRKYFSGGATTFAIKKSADGAMIIDPITKLPVLEGFHVGKGLNAAMGAEEDLGAAKTDIEIATTALFESTPRTGVSVSNPSAAMVTRKDVENFTLLFGRLLGASSGLKIHGDPLGTTHRRMEELLTQIKGTLAEKFASFPAGQSLNGIFQRIDVDNVSQISGTVRGNVRDLIVQLDTQVSKAAAGESAAMTTTVMLGIFLPNFFSGVEDREGWGKTSGIVSWFYQPLDSTEKSILGINIGGTRFSLLVLNGNTPNTIPDVLKEKSIKRGVEVLYGSILSKIGKVRDANELRPVAQLVDLLINKPGSVKNGTPEAIKVSLENIRLFKLLQSNASDQKPMILIRDKQSTFIQNNEKLPYQSLIITDEQGNLRQVSKPGTGDGFEIIGDDGPVPMKPGIVYDEFGGFALKALVYHPDSKPVTALVVTKTSLKPNDHPITIDFINSPSISAPAETASAAMTIEEQEQMPVKMRRVLDTTVSSINNTAVRLRLEKGGLWLGKHERAKAKQVESRTIFLEINKEDEFGVVGPFLYIFRGTPRVDEEVSIWTISGTSFENVDLHVFRNLVLHQETLTENPTFQNGVLRYRYSIIRFSDLFTAKKVPFNRAMMTPQQSKRLGIGVAATISVLGTLLTGWVLLGDQKELHQQLGADSTLWTLVSTGMVIYGWRMFEKIQNSAPKKSGTVPSPKQLEGTLLSDDRVTHNGPTWSFSNSTGTLMSLNFFTVRSLVNGSTELGIRIKEEKAYGRNRPIVLHQFHKGDQVPAMEEIYQDLQEDIQTQVTRFSDPLSIRLWNRVIDDIVSRKYDNTRAVHGNAELNRVRSSDEAMKTLNPGGIDLNAVHLNMHIKRDGNGVPLPVSQQDWKDIHIDGLVPVILKISPAAASPVLSQLAPPSL